MSKYIFIILLSLSVFSISYSRPVLKFALAVPPKSSDAQRAEKLINNIFNQLNYDCSFEYFPVERCDQVLLNEQVDGMAAKPVEELVYFKGFPVVWESFLDIPFKVYYKNKSLKTISWSELEKYKCVSIIGLKIINQKMPNAVKKRNLYTVASYLQAVKMVEAERMDFAILVESITDEIIEKEKITSVKKFDTLIASTPIYLLLSKKHKNLAPKASEVLKQMKKDGSYYKIINEFK